MNAITLAPGLDQQLLEWFKSLLDKTALLKADIFCDVDAPDYQQLECGSELGGIISIGLVKPGTWTGENDTELLAFLQDETWWSDGMGASPQTHYVIYDTRGNKPAGTPNEEEGFGLIPIERTGDDREMPFEFLNVMANRDFVAALNRRRGWGLAYVTAGKDGSTGDYQAFYAADVSIYADTLIEQSIKSRKRYSANAKWSTDMTPDIPFLAPASIFVP
jgi:hypothetical protein